MKRAKKKTEFEKWWLRSVGPHATTDKHIMDWLKAAFNAGIRAGRKERNGKRALGYKK